MNETYQIERARRSQPEKWETAGEFIAGSLWRDGRPVNDETMREEAIGYYRVWPDYLVRVRCPNGEILKEKDYEWIDDDETLRDGLRIEKPDLCGDLALGLIELFLFRRGAKSEELPRLENWIASPKGQGLYFGFRAMVKIYRADEDPKWMRMLDLLRRRGFAYLDQMTSDEINVPPRVLRHTMKRFFIHGYQRFRDAQRGEVSKADMWRGIATCMPAMRMRFGSLLEEVRPLDPLRLTPLQKDFVQRVCGVDYDDPKPT